jgi:hypothetical protein
VKRGVEWAAGLFEGEGTIVVRRRGPGGLSLQLSLYSTDKDVVRAFRQVVRIGSVCGPYPRKDGHKAMYQWYAFGENGKRVLRCLVPYFCSRRRKKTKEALSV